MSRVMKAAPFVVLCALIVAVPSVWAFWVQDGVAICTAKYAQYGHEITSDGAGGAIITWYDYRGQEYHIYAQRVNASGTVQWTTDGVAICTAAQSQEYPHITSDGAGGAIVMWEDFRNGNWDIYAQRVNASGAVQWTADGVPICTTTAFQTGPMVASDGGGGAIITWHDNRSGNWDIYAQRVNAAGSYQWTWNGAALCTATGDQTVSMIISDGAGGAIVTWGDYRGGTRDIYAQKVNASGTVQWTANGVALCTLPNDQSSSVISSDGAGGAIIAFEDYRTATGYDIVAQRVSAAGLPQWTANGVTVCSAANYQRYPEVNSDGNGGAVIVWQDNRTTTDWDVYGQRINASGNAQWAVNGIAICTAVHDQTSLRLTSNGTGGAIIAWSDLRSGSNYKIYAQDVSNSGVPRWTVGGVALCGAAGDQYPPSITSDGAGGAIVEWRDFRTGEAHVYAQSIDSEGRIGFLAPSIYAVRDVPGDQGGKVYLSWYGARSDVYMDSQMSYYSIWRAINPTKAALALEHGASSLEDLSKLDLSSGKPVIRIEQASGRTFFWELMETVDALYMPGYGKPIATLFDSTTICREYHYFQVVAHTTTPTVFWKSEPDSGYSVDNIAPGVPKALEGEQSYAPVGIALNWNRNTEADLGHYAVYRGTNAGFVPGAGNLIASPYDTTTFDGSWRWSGGYYYKVSAIDIHGNESGFAILAPDEITGTDTPKAPEASYLSQNYPNPFNPMTRISFGLSAPGHVSLKIYDASGRLVRVLVNTERRAGGYEETWDGRDSEGRSVASGIYFFKLNAGNFESTRKMILVR